MLFKTVIFFLGILTFSSCNELMGPAGEIGEGPDSSSSPSTYQVSYSGNGADAGTVPVDSNIYQPGSSATILGNTGSLARTGYTYTGWNANTAGTSTIYSAGSSVTLNSNLILYAQWQGNSYTVTFDTQGGDPVTPSTLSVVYGQSYGSLPTPTKTGSDFGGWWTGAGATGTLITGTSLIASPSNHSLYASWTLYYMLTYDANGATTGTVPSDSGHYQAGNTVTLADNSGSLTRTGYTFSGWNSASDGTGTSYPINSTLSMPASDLLLYATWNSVLLSVTRSDVVSLETSMSTTAIDNSDGNLIPHGTVIAYKTSSGYHGELVVVGDSTNNGWIIDYVTYNTDGTILQQGSSITIMGTYTYDLDGDTVADFQLRNQTTTIRDFYPMNGAIFYRLP